jgi:hypothetical protein
MKRILKWKLAMAGVLSFAISFLWTVLPLHV